MNKVLTLLSLAILWSVPAGAQTEQTATIENTGSTNVAGWRVTIHPDGRAEDGSTVDTVTALPPGRTGLRPAPTTVNAIPPDLAQKFFADLAEAGPLGQYPATHCMKSASFGVREYIEYGGQKSPDISCPDYDKKLESVVSDARQIARTLKLRF